jgi:glycosyltransferase involved in cell wall biosynthesis
MRVIIFSYLFPNKFNKNSGTFNLSRAKALQDLGHKVLVIAPISYGFPLSYLFPKIQYKTIINDITRKKNIPLNETIQGIEVIHPKYFGLPRKLIWQHSDYELKFYIGRKIKKIVLSFKPELIMAPWIHPYGSYLRFIKKYWNFIAFAIADGSDLLIYPEIFSGWKRVEKKLNKACNLIFCASREMTQYAHDETKLINLKQMNLGYSKQSFVYDKNVVKDNHVFKLISVGNLRYVKGHDILLDAMVVFNDYIHLSIVGEGPERPRLERFISNNNLHSKVTLLGELSSPQILVLLQQSHLFCMPSRSEGFGIAPLEAMAVGLPVIVSNVGAMQDYVIEGFNGYVFKSEDVGDMVKKILKAKRASWQPSKISSYASKKFTWDRWAINIEAEYMHIKNKEITQ